jgi:glutathione S-transferase
MKLYTNPFSTFARRVDIALREKNIDAERVIVDMGKREHRSETYMALHPYGRVPTLVDGDFVLPESTPILEYLEAKYPEPALVPPDAKGRALVSLHMKLCDLELAGPNYTTVFSKRFVPRDKWRVDEMERAKKPTERHLKVLGTHLDGKDFLVAERFTLAEVCYIPFLYFIDLLDVEVPASVQRWSKALSARPSVIATVPQM